MSILRRVESAIGVPLSGSGARASSWALLGQGSTAVASTASFVLLARIFGPATYGSIAGTLALVLGLGLLAYLGANTLVVRDIAAARLPSAAALSAALITVVAGATVACLVLLALHPVLLPQVPLELLMTLAVAELFGNGVTACCASSFYGAGRARAAGLTTTGAALAKLTAVLLFAVQDSDDPLRWAALYITCALLAAALSAIAAFARFGRPVLRGYRPLARAHEGVPFSIALTANAVQNDADKVLLVRFGYTEEAGLYTAAYRLATLTLLPVQAVLQAAYARFFTLGSAEGLRGTAALSRRLLRPLATYAAVVAAILAGGAGVMPLVLGEEYRGSVPLLMLLAPLALFKVLQYMPSEALTGAGHQVTRTKCMVTSALLSLLLCFLLIPPFGLVGALLSTLGAEVTYVVLVRLALRRGLRSEHAAAAA